MTCIKAIPTAPRRAIIHTLFVQGKIKSAVSHRLFQCTHATKCGRLCENLLKGPGKSEVYCTTHETHLYTALKDLSFKCPKGLF